MGDEHMQQPEDVVEETIDEQLEEQERAREEALDDAGDDVHAQSEQQQPPAVALGDLDDHAMDVTPEVGIAQGLRNALDTMRDESRRIAALGTGEEQVEAAERFAEDAGRLDEQVGAAARAADDDERG